MDEHEAVEALKELGLTGYEAKVFIALQRLGSGGARDVAEVTDVPRPQVYSTAESLEDRGLIDVQQSDPIAYRPVGIDEAKAKLSARFERTRETAFDYIERVQREGREDEEREEVWTVTGRETIDSRIKHLADQAERRISLGIPSESLLRDDVVDALGTAAERGVSVTIISRDVALADRFTDAEGIDVVDPAIEESEDVSGRLLVVDDATVLLSVLGGEDRPESSVETAIWSEETGFARVLIRLIESYLRRS